MNAAVFGGMDALLLSAANTTKARYTDLHGGQILRNLSIAKKPVSFTQTR
mgnify:CR=1 FL=1